MLRLRLELWRQKSWLLHSDNAPSHNFFSPGNFLPKQQGSHFDTTEMIEGESQAVMNILRGHDFQSAFKNGRSAGNGAYAWKGTTSKVMVASRSKVSF
jgi:hypothetical protein